ncbi:PadR family transcriptional regulator [Nocardioides sp. YR527]|uniref:PadR family transcriptional regulator n=1 Tax=Nocardioides sp. YR527 TaxID=1881028 RepID=UPI001C40B87F|nr:PadR family transcriptional regulator [Nocardioides sp. YR527]
MSIVDVMVLGFLAEGRQHGYELRRKIEQLHGHTRRISDGTLYPAIDRLERNGYVAKEAAPGRGRAGRHTLTLTDVGRRHLLDVLRAADGHDITDATRFFVVLTFLSLLPDRADQHAVLRRRLTFLETPASFFYDGNRPIRAEEVVDPYRRGLLLTARATSAAEKAWIREEIDS